METIDSLSDIEISIAIPSGRFKKISKCDFHVNGYSLLDYEGSLKLKTGFTYLHNIRISIKNQRFNKVDKSHFEIFLNRPEGILKSHLLWFVDIYNHAGFCPLLSMKFKLTI
jgi:hypothetical protein